MSIIVKEDNYLSINDEGDESGIEIIKYDSNDISIEAYEARLSNEEIKIVIEFLQQPYVSPNQLNLF